MTLLPCLSINDRPANAFNDSDSPFERISKLIFLGLSDPPNARREITLRFRRRYCAENGGSGKGQILQFIPSLKDFSVLTQSSHPAMFLIPNLDYKSHKEVRVESQLDRPTQLNANQPNPSQVLPSQALPAQVLIVDRSDDSREVLKTILASKGISTVDADQSANGLELLQSLEPTVTVLDADSAESTPVDEFVSAARQRNGSLVILGATRRDAEDDAAPHLIRKPYHYGALIRKIEELVDRVHSE